MSKRLKRHSAKGGRYERPTDRTYKRHSGFYVLCRHHHDCGRALHYPVLWKIQPLFWRKHMGIVIYFYPVRSLRRPYHRRTAQNLQNRAERKLLYYGKRKEPAQNGNLQFFIAVITCCRLFLYLTPAVLIVILVFVIAGLFSKVLSQVFEKAVTYKQENDLTI